MKTKKVGIQASAFSLYKALQHNKQEGVRLGKPLFALIIVFLLTAES
ncbi:MAG: hypothetical protein ABH870_02530 [bacterium]